jgi:RNA polymerase sigma-70 factor (ECF subfamily)
MCHTIHRTVVLCAMDDAAPEPATTALVADWWSAYRRLVRDVAYRVLGSVTDADDVTQDTFVRLVDHGTDGIADPRAWLVTVCTRLCLDRLRAHEHSRRAYPGPWLPEPIVAESHRAPDDQVTLDDSVRMALMVVLERLTPAERTAFLLHDVFGLEFPAIAEAVGRSPQACRQLASRARRRIAASPTRSRFPTSHAQLRELCDRFARACAGENLAALVALLEPDASGDFDSGGLLPEAPLTMLRGSQAIAERLLAAFAGLRLRFDVTMVNGEPGVLVVTGRRVVTVLTFIATNDRISAVHAIGNPNKLRHLQRRDPLGA